MSTIRSSDKIFVAGHRGMVGSAIVRSLESQGYSNLVLRGREELDLCDQSAVANFFQSERPDYVLLAAARVGGIHANNEYPADFIYDNLVIQTNVIHHAFLAGVKNLLFLGSSCIYPRLASQPMGESSLLTGTLESTNEPYAIAKIAGIKLCESYNRQHGVDYRSAMPTNLYGPNDNFNLENSHVIPALLRKFHDAKVVGSDEVVVWGSGKVKREFLHVEDMANACLHLAKLEKSEFSSAVEPMLSHINVGTGVDVSISELAEAVGKVVGFNGKIVFDSSKPDGTPRKLLDVAKLHRFGWQHQYTLQAGLSDTYNWFLENIEDIRCK